jgi:microcystin-dependent protein
MAFTRQTSIDASPTGDSVKQAILDLDQDLTGAYAALNTLGTSLALKIGTALMDVAGGVAGLDASGLLKVAEFPASTLLPIGSFLLWSTATPPSNYLECNGASLSTTDYPALFQVIQYTYGGAGLSFSLPDWRGRFPRGWNHGAALDPDAAARTNGGDAVGSLQNAAVLDHQHGLIGSTGVEYAAGSNWGGIQGSSVYGYTNSLSADPGSYSPDTNISAYETRPVNMATMICIKWR